MTTTAKPSALVSGAIAMETESFFMRFPGFNRETFWALWFAPLVCFVVSGILFWWGLR